MNVPVFFTDGGCSGNPGPMGIGVVVMAAGKVITRIQERPEGSGTNNVAEYMAIIRALEYAVEHGFPEIIVKSDSQLCVGQLSAGWKVREPRLQQLNANVRKLEEQVKVTYVHIPREENPADALSNMGV